MILPMAKFSVKLAQGDCYLTLQWECQLLVESHCHQEACMCKLGIMPSTLPTTAVSRDILTE